MLPAGRAFSRARESTSSIKRKFTINTLSFVTVKFTLALSAYGNCAILSSYVKLLSRDTFVECLHIKVQRVDDNVPKSKINCFQFLSTRVRKC